MGQRSVSLYWVDTDQSNYLLPQAVLSAAHNCAILKPVNTANSASNLQTGANDEWLFGWDDTPGIVSVWAERSGHALVWQRQGERVLWSHERFRPFLFACSLDDVDHLGAGLAAEGSPEATQARVCYQQLAGSDEQSYRYLLTAGDYRQLEAAILYGASRRLGRRAARITELDDYYTVGTVEQYLMQTGRVYYRGLTYADLHRLQFDLETTALDPAEGRIFMVAVRDGTGFETVLEATRPEDEARLITDLCAVVQERNPDIIENHNLLGFDLPFLTERARRLNVPLHLGRSPGPTLLESRSEPASYRRSRRNRYSVAGREMTDTLDAVWRHDFSTRDMSGYGLKAVARYFGVAATDRTYIPGAAVYSTYQTDPEQVRRYALDDVREVDSLSTLLMGAAFALSGMAPRRYGRIASAGPATGILEPMLVRAYVRAGHALPYGAAAGDAELPGHSGGATYLFQGGVAKHVVKADIASMYPSIMRVYGIGPECDQLGVLVGLVDRLVTLRLHHKQAAREAAPGSTEASQHGAVANAMKILVNSAYGYMGAGRMALFADRHAADRVTSTGRAILDQVVAGLKARGVVLLEADTDGVFFAVPEGWTEAEERTLVAAVARELPDGIKLEYEGRYQAMLSHEVKNYALLTYDGRLILRGGALRSSRSERFGVCFLEQAMACLLRGDVAGLVQVYLEVTTAIREGQVPLADVASIARLTKSADEYLARRQRLREGPYEALVAAGRSDWAAGERVRFYRASGGRYVWLPDRADEPEVGNVVGSEDTDEAIANLGGLPGYDVQHYLRVLHTAYVSRLRKAFRDEDFQQLFRPQLQLGMFDQPVAAVEPLWISTESVDKLALVTITADFSLWRYTRITSRPNCWPSLTSKRLIRLRAAALLMPSASATRS